MSARQLNSQTQCYLDFLLQAAFEDGPHNVPLTRLETVRHRRNGPNVVGHRERMSSSLMKSSYVNTSSRWSRKVQGYKVQLFVLSNGMRLTLNWRSQSLRSSAFLLLKAVSMSPRSWSCSSAKGITCFSMCLKYSRASESLLVPRPYHNVSTSCDDEMGYRKTL